MKIIKTATDEKIMVSNEDYDTFTKYLWHLDNDGYAYRFTYRGRKRKRVYMHRVVLTPREGYINDHEDRNRLNNTRENLRHLTPAQNARNRTKMEGTITLYKGVKKIRDDEYRAQIGFNYMRHIIGTKFPTPELAAAAYDIWARKLDKAFTTNFEEDNPILADVEKLLDDDGYYKPAKAATSSRSSSSYVGVKFDKQKNSYIATISYKGKKFKLGSNVVPEIAAQYRDTAMVILKGPDVMLNFPGKEPIDKIVQKANKILTDLGPLDSSVVEIVQDDQRKETSKYRGVYIQDNKFSARITHDGELHSLGSYHTEEEAATAYNVAAVKFRGKHATVNKL